MLAFIIIGYAILFIIDGYPVSKQYTKATYRIYTFIFISAFILSFLRTVNINIPSPSTGIKNIITLIIGE